MSDNPELKPAAVEKEIEVQYDIGNLAVYDPAPLDPLKISDSTERETYLKSITRNNVQLLINQVLSQPLVSKSVDSKTQLTVVELPDPIYPLPREKSAPKPKQMTRWEKFAAAKGIQQRGKKDSKVFDEATGEWVNKWGFKGKNSQVDDQWLVEVDDEKTDADGNEIDARKLSRQERKQLVKRNQAQQMRNRRAEQ